MGRGAADRREEDDERSRSERRHPPEVGRHDLRAAEYVVEDPALHPINRPGLHLLSESVGRKAMSMNTDSANSEKAVVLLQSEPPVRYGETLRDLVATVFRRRKVLGYCFGCILLGS